MTSSTTTSSGTRSGDGKRRARSLGHRPGLVARRSRLATAVGTTLALALGTLTAAAAPAGASPAPAAAAAGSIGAVPASGTVTASPAAAALVAQTAPDVIIDLCAKAGSATFPTGTGGTSSVPFWGYTQGTNCGSPTTPGGPTLVVEQGKRIQINLHNSLPEPTSLALEGQGLVPDQVGAPATSGSASYTFTPSQPGTYIYEAGLTPNSQQEIALGLYGALVVRPTGAPSLAYPGTPAFNTEAVLVLSELDPALTPSNYNTTYDMRNYAPTLGLINGVPSPNPTGAISANAGDTVLLRYVNAGVQYHSMSVLGANQTMLATDGRVLPDPFEYVAETFGPGQSADVLLKVPAASPAGTKLTLFEGSMALHNPGKKTNLATSKPFGGMVTFISVGTGSTTDTFGPITNNVTYDGTTGALSAMISDATTGGSTIAAAEYFIDTTPADASTYGTGPTQMTVNGNTATATITPPLTGTHTIYVHGKDGVTPTGNWGGFSQVTYTPAPPAGPVVSGATATLTVTPPTASLAVQATATSTSGGNITAAEFTFDGGPATAMTVGTAATVAPLNGTLAMTSLAAGPHQVAIRAQDANGVWGNPVTATFTAADTTGPTSTVLSVTPSPNNGTQAVNSSSAAVRVTATLNDLLPSSPIVSAEMFLCTAVNPNASTTTAGCSIGTTGTGVVMTPNDGSWNSSSESAYADIPLTTVSGLADGLHTIYVHSKDAAGFWGAPATSLLRIDKTVPTLPTSNALSVILNQPFGPTSASVTVNGAADPLVPAGTGYASGLAGGEYWVNPPTSTAPAPGSGTAFTGSTFNLNLTGLGAGTYTLNVRVKDVAGNWSGVRNAAVQVVPDAIFSANFDTGNRPWTWSSASTNTTGRLDVSAAAAQGGSARGLQAQGNNTNYVQYNLSGNNPATATFDARFYFNPNNNAGTGQDILAAATSSGFNTQLFHVRYRRNGTQPQVQIQVGGTTNAAWVNIANAYTRIEVVWQPGGALTLSLNGTVAQTLSVAATNNTVASFRLGSVTSGGNATLMYFDTLAAKRSPTPPLGA